MNYFVVKISDINGDSCEIKCGPSATLRSILKNAADNLDADRSLSKAIISVCGCDFDSWNRQIRNIGKHFIMASGDNLIMFKITEMVEFTSMKWDNHFNMTWSSVRQ